MKNKLEKLIALQAVESQMAKLANIINKAPNKIAELDVRIEEVQKAYDDDKSGLDDLKKHYRSLEADLQTNQSQITRSKEKLSSVKTNKEYQAMLKQIDELAKTNNKIEEEMISVLEQIESNETQVSQQKVLLDKKIAEVTTEKTAVIKDMKETEQQLGSIKEKQTGLAEQIDADLIATYNRVKSMVTGAAVVPVSSSVCKGCHLNIPPQMYNELQRGDNLKYCPHCARILYWDNELS